MLKIVSFQHCTHKMLLRSGKRKGQINDSEGPGPKQARLTRNKQKNFNELPCEIKSHIFSFLKFKDLMSSTLVCHSWNGIISSNSKLTGCVLYKIRHLSDIGQLQRKYKHIRLEIHNMSLVIGDLENTFGQIKQAVESIKLRVTDSYANIKSLLEFFPNLCTLELDEVRYRSADFSTQAENQHTEPMNLSKLESFSIRASNYNFASTCLLAINPDGTHLKTFKLTGKFISHNESDRPLRRRLSIALVTFFNDQVSLKKVELSSNVPCMILTDPNRFNPVFTLDELKIKGCPFAELAVDFLVFRIIVNPALEIFEASSHRVIFDAAARTNYHRQNPIELD